MIKNEEIMKENEKNENFKTIEDNSPSKDGNLPYYYRNKNVRSLLIKKIGKEENLKKHIKTEINEYFNSPDKYFDINSPIFVNKKINLKEINKFQKPINNVRLIKRSSKIMSNFSSFKNRQKLRTSVMTSSSGNNIINNNLEQLPKYEIIDNEKLKDIFELYQDNNYKKSFIKDNHLESNNHNFPLDISKSLSVQNQRLRHNRINQKKFRQMSGILSKRLNKFEKDLLINSVDSYRYKKELINDINNKQFSEIQPRYYWKMNLRRGKDLERKELYINIKNDYDPFYAVIVDNFQKKKELRFKSGLDLNSREVKDFKKNKYLIDNYLNKMHHLENLKTLNVKGKNLFNLEYKREMSSKKRKILHRVFIENGKEILDTDINDVFGEETIYKNYPKDILKYEKKNISNSNINISKNSNYLI